MSNYSNLIGRPYIDGRQDCYSVARDYYFQNWGIELPNLARPDRFWDDPELDLYKNYTKTGFYPVLNDVYKVGDAVLLPILSQINSHAGVIVEDNRMLHHLPYQLSSVDALRPKWIGRVMVHLRHPKVETSVKVEEKKVHLHEVIHADVLRNPEFQKQIEKALGS